MRVSIKSKVVNIKLQCYLITGWMDLYDIFIETHVILLNFPALEIKLLSALKWHSAVGTILFPLSK